MLAFTSNVVCISLAQHTLCGHLALVDLNLPGDGSMRHLRHNVQVRESDDNADNAMPSAAK